MYGCSIYIMIIRIGINPLFGFSSRNMGIGIKVKGSWAMLMTVTIMMAMIMVMALVIVRDEKELLTADDKETEKQMLVMALTLLRSRFPTSLGRNAR